MKTLRRLSIAQQHSSQQRKGNVLVLAAGTLVLVFAFTAFTVDVGYITTSKAELNRATDASALGASLELTDAYGPGKIYTQDQAADKARQAAHDIAHLNKSAGDPSTYVENVRDVRLGQYTYDSASDSWIKTWGVSPYNLVEVTARRDQAGSGNGDSPLDLFFAPVIGTQQADVVVKSTAALLPGVGFKKIPGQNIGILPITLDKYTWDNLIDNHIGLDNYAYDPATGVITPGADGILEVNLYPEGSIVLPAGNRGTLDIGNTSNATSDLTRQILYGLNDDDWAGLAAQGVTELRWDGPPIDLQGDTGLSAGIKDELNAIRGIPKAIPIFTQVSGPGNNAIYTIVQFVGIRIMHVKLQGLNKHVYIQPAPFYDGAVIWGETQLTDDTIFAPATLVP